MYTDALRRIYLVLLIICSTLFSSYAQGKNFFVSATDPSWIVKIPQATQIQKPDDVSDGYYLSLYERQNHAELQENYTHIIREIVSDAGVQNGSEVSVTYDPSYQKLTFHHITVWRNGKAANKLFAHKFKLLQNEKELSKFIYSGTYDAYLILDDIRKGDRIEYAYTLKGDNPIFGSKYANSFYFESSAAIGRRYTNLIVSKSRKLNFRNYNFNTAPKTSEKDGFRLYEWDDKNTKTYRSAKFEPSWYNPYKHTQVSEYQSWNEIVNWGLRVNDYPGLKMPLVEQKAQELLSKANRDTKKYIELAIRFVQDEVRYMGVEMGVYSQRPNSPEKVLQQRYGDCKDKSLLLINLLTKAGVPSYMAYADTYDGKKTDEFLPSPVLFDHAVVVIEYNHKKIWIDPTISNQRGHLDQLYFPNYGKALVLKPGVTKPEAVISRPTGKMVATTTIYAADTAGIKKTRLTIHTVYTGSEADDVRTSVAEQGLTELGKTYLEYISGYYPDTESEGTLKTKDNEETNTLEITETYLIPALWNKDEEQNSRYYAYFYADLIQHALRKITGKNRTQPLALIHPKNIEQHIYVHLPAAWNADAEEFESKTDNYEFRYKASVTEKIMTLDYTYLSLRDHVEPKEIKKYIRDTEILREKLSYGLYWGGRLGDGPSDVNNALVLLSILCVIVSGIFFIRIYQQQYEFDIEDIAKALPVRGWLIIVGIDIISSPLSACYQLSESDLFKTSSWLSVAKLSTAAQITAHTIDVLNVLTYSILFAWSLLLVFLFCNRRELFPQQYHRFLYFSIAAILFYKFGEYIKHTLTGEALPALKEYIKVIFTIIYATIWINYIKRSQRVADTFVFTYPASMWRFALIKYLNKKINTKPDNNTHQQQVNETTATDEHKNNKNENV